MLKDIVPKKGLSGNYIILYWTNNKLLLMTLKPVNYANLSDYKTLV